MIRVISELNAGGNLEMNIKRKRSSLTTFPNTLKFVKNTPLSVLFSTPFSMVGNVVKEMWSFLFDILVFYHITKHRGERVENTTPSGIFLTNFEFELTILKGVELLPVSLGH